MRLLLITLVLLGLSCQQVIKVPCGEQVYYITGTLPDSYSGPIGFRIYVSMNNKPWRIVKETKLSTGLKINSDSLTLDSCQATRVCMVSYDDSNLESDCDVKCLGLGCDVSNK